MVDKVQATRNEFLDAINEPHTSGLFVRKLALAIIRANPASSSRSEKQRMNDALKHLLGDTYQPDSKTTELKAALNWIAEQYVDDRGGPQVDMRNPLDTKWLDTNPPAARTVKQLAADAHRVFDFAPAAQHLENEFGKRKHQLCLATIHRSDVPDSMHQQALKQIQELIQPYGVQMNISDN